MAESRRFRLVLAGQEVEVEAAGFEVQLPPRRDPIDLNVPFELCQGELEFGDAGRPLPTTVTVTMKDGRELRVEDATVSHAREPDGGMALHVQGWGDLEAFRRAAP